MIFRTVIQLHGKTATGIEVPEEIIARLGSHKRPPVRVTIGQHTYQSTIAPMGGKFLLPVSAENRDAAGVSAGDEVDVQIELDDSPRLVEVPADLLAALDHHATAKHRFEKLSNSKQRMHVMSVEGAKTAETRQRRIDKVISALQ
jgi:hypothetical protein